MDLIDSVTFISQNICKYAQTITHSYFEYYCIEELYEIREAHSAAEKFVTFIENETG